MIKCCPSTLGSSQLECRSPEGHHTRTGDQQSASGQGGARPQEWDSRLQRGPMSISTKQVVDQN